MHSGTTINNQEVLWRCLSDLVRQTGRKDNCVSVLITLPVLDRSHVSFGFDQQLIIPPCFLKVLIVST